MNIKHGERIKVRITIVAELSSPEYEDTENIIDEFNAEAHYEIKGTPTVDVHSTEWRDTELIIVDY